MAYRRQAGEGSEPYASAGKTQRVTVTLPEEVADELVRESVDAATTVSAVVREAVMEYFTSRETEGLPEFVGMAEHADPTLSERVEEIIRDDFGTTQPHE